MLCCFRVEILIVLNECSKEKVKEKPNEMKRGRMRCWRCLLSCLIPACLNLDHLALMSCRRLCL